MGLPMNPTTQLNKNKNKKKQHKKTKLLHRIEKDIAFSNF
jgi:hypothetical protein